MKVIDIAKLFKIPKQNVNYWLHYPVIIKRKRRTKLIRPEINIIIKWARDKPINLCSAKKVMNKFNLLSKKEKKRENRRRSPYQQQIRR